MDKEAKELIEQLEEYASGGGSGLYPFEESVKALLDYINQLEKGSYIEEGINGQWTNWKFEAENYKRVCDGLYKRVNQLETNRDEAIEYIKHSWWLRTDQTYDTSKDLKGWEVKELLSILERGKE